MYCFSWSSPKGWRGGRREDGGGRGERRVGGQKRVGRWGRGGRRGEGGGGREEGEGGGGGREEVGGGRLEERELHIIPISNTGREMTSSTDTKAPANLAKEGNPEVGSKVPPSSSHDVHHLPEGSVQLTVHLHYVLWEEDGREGKGRRNGGKGG